MKHYSVDSQNKQIVAAIRLLTDKEMAEVQRYQAFGYTVIDGKPVVAPKAKRLDDDFIRNYLGDDKDAVEAYEAAMKKPALDDDGNVKMTKATKKKPAKVMEQGFNAGRNWFATTYPKSQDKLDELTKDKKEAIEKAWKAYADKNKGNAEALTHEQYIRFYYWTKIFTK